MIQIFIFGSSFVYGVGAETAGWADLVKRHYHEKMYSQDGEGEKYEVYNFGLSGATIDFVAKTAPVILDNYGRNGKRVIMLSLGGNNAKAENTPDNYVSTIEDFEKEMSTLLEKLKTYTSHVIAIGGGYLDENKTNPKHNPLTGGKSYMRNDRKKIFEHKVKELCESKGMKFIEIGISESEWKEKYLYVDGVHPNQAGHEFVAKKVIIEIEKTP